MDGPWVTPYELEETDQNGNGRLDPLLDEEGNPIVDQDKLNRYQYNGIEKTTDLGLNWGLAVFRSYDPALGRWMQVDPLAEFAPGWTPFRNAFNNPLIYIDPFGLFETRKQARQWAKENGVRVGWFTRGRIKKEKDGSFSVTRKEKNGVKTSTNYDPETADLLGGQSNGDGTVTSVTITPTDMISVGRSTLFKSPGWKLRDGSFEFPEHERMSPAFPVGTTASGANKGITLLTQYPLPRVPKGQVFWDTVKKRVAKGGEVMRSKLSDYIRLLKKGERGRKSPATHTSKNIRDVDRDMEELLKNYGRFIKKHLDGPPDGF